MWEGNKTFTIETTIKDIYEVDDDIVGIECSPNPNHLKAIHRTDELYYDFKHKQNNDLYLRKNHIHYNIFNNILKIGSTFKFTYNIVLCKHFDDEENYKTEKSEPFSLGNMYHNYKLKHKNNKKRVYSNYIIDVVHCPIYRDTIRVLNILKYNDDYYEIDPVEDCWLRFLIHRDDVNLFCIRETYTICYQKSHHNLNYYMITRVQE